MENDNQQLNEDDDDGSSGLAQQDLLKSYLAFGLRAARKRRGLMAVIFFPLLVITFVVAAVWPRTYHCESKLMTLRNQVLEGKAEGPGPLDGASGMMTRRENLLAIATRADLVKAWDAKRPPFLRTKDHLLEMLRGKPSDADVLNTLAATLEQKLSASANDGTLTIAVDWSDPETAARIVEVAQQTFMEARHAAEISIIEEKISILDGHAGKLREEIDRIAEELQRIRENKLAEAGKAMKDPDAPGMIAPSPAAAAPIRRAPRPAAAAPDEDLPKLKEELEAKKRLIADLETDRNHRLVEAKARLQELQYKYTPAHPSVLLAGQNVDTLSHETAQVTEMRAEVAALDADVKARIAAAKADPGTSSGPYAAAASPLGLAGRAATSTTEPLPPKILSLLEGNAGVDPAVSMQLQGAVGKYGALRDAIRTALIDLDTAQAAFNHRYQVIMPAEVPSKPSKPKIPLIIGAGLALALLLSLLVPVILELRRGVIVERWQLDLVQLPVLAELELPPGSHE